MARLLPQLKHNFPEPIRPAWARHGYQAPPNVAAAVFFKRSMSLTYSSLLLTPQMTMLSSLTLRLQRHMLKSAGLKFQYPPRVLGLAAASAPRPASLRVNRSQGPPYSSPLAIVFLNAWSLCLQVTMSIPTPTSKTQ